MAYLEKNKMKTKPKKPKKLVECGLGIKLGGKIRRVWLEGQIEESALIYMARSNGEEIIRVTITEI